MDPPIGTDFRRFFCRGKACLALSPLRARCVSVPLCEPQRRAASHPCHGEAPPGAEAISQPVGDRARWMVSWRAAVGGDAISQPVGERGLPLTPPSRGIASGPGRSSAAPLQGPRNDMVRLSTDWHRFALPLRPLGEGGCRGMRAGAREIANEELGIAGGSGGDFWGVVKGTQMGADGSTD